MKYFLIPDGESNYKIMKVQPEDLAGFYKRYRREILLEADSITELLVLFGMKLDHGGLDGTRGEKKACDINGGDKCE